MGFSLVVAGIGAAIGLFGAAKRSREAREEARRQKEYAEAMYKLNTERAEQEFEASKEQAERNASQAEQQADLADKSLDVTEQGLSNDFNAAIDNLYLSQEADTMNWNAQAMGMKSAEGNSLAAVSASGVRAGSSLSNAVEMESAVNAAQLQFSQDAKRRSDSNNLASVLNNLAGQKYGIEQNRIGADITRDNAAYLRASYEEGGRNWNLYQNQLESFKTTTEYQTAALDNTIEKNSGWNAFGNMLIGGFQGFSSGLSTGYKMKTTWDKLKAYEG